jgi:hypothetical protein
VPERGHALSQVNLETMAPAVRPAGGRHPLRLEPRPAPASASDGFSCAGYRTSARFDSLLAS